MLKYANSDIVFQEIPDEVTLAINITNCPCRCPGCHSSYLWKDEGLPLDGDAINTLLAEEGAGITCVSFMGGDAEPAEVCRLAAWLHAEHPKLKAAWYTGKTVVPAVVDKSLFSYIKVGPYIKHLGALNSRTTNQRLYRRRTDGTFEDITSRFWRKAE